MCLNALQNESNHKSHKIKPNSAVILALFLEMPELMREPPAAAAFFSAGPRAALVSPGLRAICIPSQLHGHRSDVVKWQGA